MTICLGVLSGEGIVIAADTQETTGDTKQDQQKIFNYCYGVPHPGTSTPSPMMLLLTGAGDPGYLDAFFYLLSQDAGTCTNMQEFERYMADELMRFHQAHIFPIAVPGEPPTLVEVLAAVTCGWEMSLFVTQGSTVRKASVHTAIGAGRRFAQSLLSQHAWCKTLREAQLLAAYVIYETKSRELACGLHTSMSTLHNCSISDVDGKREFIQPSTPMECGFDQRILRKWEASFEMMWKTRQKDLLSDLLSKELADTEFFT